MKRALVVALLGAESTGKTTLAHALCEALAAEGRRTAVVGEVLREFCDREARTPRIDEQAGIAREQTRRIALAAEAHDIVIADTTAVMTAVYSELVFGDRSLYDEALAMHRRCDLTLVTALDLPWIADGLQRDGPHVREPVDMRVRAALRHAGIDHAVVFGEGPARLACALTAVRHALGEPSAEHDRAANPRWQWRCERCGDADCEQHLFRGLAPQD